MPKKKHKTNNIFSKKIFFFFFFLSLGYLVLIEEREGKRVSSIESVKREQGG
jgi:hypothetical protein